MIFRGLIKSIVIINNDRSWDFKVISGKEHTIYVGALREAPLRIIDKSNQNLVQIFRKIT